MSITPRQYGPGPAYGAMMDQGNRFKASDIIRSGMAYLDEHGWCQGGIASSSGEVCGHGGVEAYAQTEFTKMPPRIMKYKESPFDFSAAKAFVEGRELASVPIPPVVEWVENPDHDAFDNARHAAHYAMVQVAQRAGWKSQGQRLSALDMMYLTPEELTAYLAEPHVPFKDAFAVFNDDPGTTIEDVAMMMKEAIVWLEERGL